VTLWWHHSRMAVSLVFEVLYISMVNVQIDRAAGKHWYKTCLRVCRVLSPCRTTVGLQADLQLRQSFFSSMCSSISFRSCGMPWLPPWKPPDTRASLLVPCG
jgi:hypothetical protein